MNTNGNLYDLNIQKTLNENLHQLVKEDFFEATSDILTVKGFTNSHNNCYQNVIFQCLFQIPLFHSIMKSLQPFEKVVNWAECEFPILFTVWRIFRDYTTLACETLPHESKLCAIMKIPQGTQQDVEEFAVSLLNGLHEELQKLCSRPIVKPQSADLEIIQEPENDHGDDSGWVTVSKDKKVMQTEIVNETDLCGSIIAEHFSGSTIMALTNTPADAKHSGHVEAFWVIPLDISNPTVKSLPDALRNYFSSREVVNSQGGVRSTFFYRLPSILTLQFKRFIYRNKGIEKVKKPVAIPLNLSIPKTAVWNCHSVERSQLYRNYRLHCVIFHRGQSVDHGHYVVAVYSPAVNAFYVCDDANVDRVSVQSVNALLTKSIIPTKLKHLRDCDPYVVIYTQSQKSLPTDK